MSVLIRITKLSLCLTLGLVWTGIHADPADGEDQGARLYREYCVLCHGIYGMGEGILPMTLKSFPSTSLMNARYGTDISSIREVISDCKSDNKPVSAGCAPFGDELNAKELDAVADFIVRFRADPAGCSAMVRDYSKQIKLRVGRGGALYRARCATCHGASGKGDGRMARLLNPPPYDFTKSTASDKYITDIVTKGGDYMGRSSSMPVFGAEMDSSQIKATVQFLKMLRE